MKRFLIKFCILFALIDGFFIYFVLVVSPQLTGDLGKVGHVVFGTEYPDSIQRLMPQSAYHVLDTNIVPADRKVSVMTIGDSFSNVMPGYRYSDALCGFLATDIVNIMTDYMPEKRFVQLMNNNHIPAGTIVVVESVERNFVKRLAGLNFDDEDDAPFESWGAEPKDYLSDAVNYIRTTLHVRRKSSLISFQTTDDVFTHPSIHNRLCSYESEVDGDGVLQFKYLTPAIIAKAYENLYKLHNLAEQNGIHLIYLIAADNLDVYEPFLVEEHVKNPTLRDCPDEVWIVNTKSLLQERALQGVKDIYYLNDTHWSPVGAQIVAEELAKRIDLLNTDGQPD